MRRAFRIADNPRTGLACDRRNAYKVLMWRGRDSSSSAPQRIAPYATRPFSESEMITEHSVASSCAEVQKVHRRLHYALVGCAPTHTFLICGG